MSLTVSTLAPGMLKLDVSGRIERSDVDLAMAAIDAAKRRSDRISLLVDLSRFDGMDGDAVLADLRHSVRELRDLSRYHRVAIVGEQTWLQWLARAEGTVLRKLDVRTFPPERAESARRWILGEEIAGDDPTPALSPIATDRSDVVAFALRGRITRADVKTMETALETALQQHSEVDCIIRLEHGAPRFDPKILLSGLTAKFGLWRRLRRYALVGAPQALRGATDVIGSLMRFEVRTFALEDEDAAWRWIGAVPAQPTPRPEPA